MYFAADAVVLGLRALSFIAVFQAAGAAFFFRFYEAELEVSRELARGLAKSSAIAALLLTALYHVLIPARMAGSFAATFDPALTELVLQSNIGPAHAVRIAGLGLIAVSLDERSRFHVVASLAGIGLAMVSFLLMGHTTIHELRTVLAPLLLIHIVVAGGWFGSLAQLHLVAARESIETSGRVIARFSDIAVRSVPLILVCGLAMSALFIRRLDALATGYGALLLAKTAAFALLLRLAAVNRLRLAPAVAAAERRAVPAFQRVLKIEWVTIAAVLAATALLTELFSPEDLHASFSSEHVEAESH